MEVIDQLKKNQVIPDVIPAAPKAALQVTYGNAIVSLGNELTPTKVKDMPKITWQAEPNALYLLCMTDPDAPSRQNPKFREWHHWLVGNIPGNEIEKGEVLSEYVGSGPPKDTGLHRYVFLLYKQPKKLQFDESRLKNNSGKGRGKFSIKKFAEKYGLGDPVAVNFFQAKWDNYVPTLYKQLGN